MIKVYIIGTLHANFTPENELLEILEEYKPNQLLVEIWQVDIDKKDIKKYPSEMQFAYNWAIENKISVLGFDCGINTFKQGVTEEDNERLIEKQKQIIKKHSWKDFNKSENNEKLNEAVFDDIKIVVDIKLENNRNKIMLENIQKNKVKEGTILILTGCGHLDFFEQNLPEAIFPLRETL